MAPARNKESGSKKSGRTVAFQKIPLLCSVLLAAGGTWGCSRSTNIADSDNDSDTSASSDTAVPSSDAPSEGRDTDPVEPDSYSDIDHATIQDTIGESNVVDTYPSERPHLPSLPPVR